MLSDKLAQLDQVLLKYDHIPVECDGHTLIVSLLLTHLKVPHKRAYGSVILSSGQVISPHFWIICHSFTVDYRLRMWGRYSVSDLDTLPHGFFPSEAIPALVEYVDMGTAITPKLSDGIIDVMTDGYWTKIKAELGI